MQTNVLGPVEPLLCHYPWCWKNSIRGRQKYFVSPKPGAARAACAAHRLQGCAGAKVPAPSPAPAAATAALSRPPWVVPNLREGKHAPRPTLQQELLQIYKFFVEFRASLKHKAQTLIEPWLAGGKEKPKK